jgi:hypothetical protein
MPFIAIFNAILREKVMSRYLNELGSHQLSTFTLMILMSLYSWFIFSMLKINQAFDVWTVGITWLILTLLFEFMAGHYVFKNPWEKLFHDYNIMKGRLWGVFIVFITILPYLVYSIKN